MLNWNHEVISRKQLTEISLSLSLSLIVLFISIATGFVAMRLFQSGGGEVEAAAVNIVVEDNDQVINVDQASSTTIITKISRVTVRDSEARYGYVLSARVSQNTLTNATITIGSADSSNCAIASPCALDDTMTNVLSTVDDNATQVDGETSEWVVTISVPANTAIGNYIVDVEYREEGKTVPNTTHGVMQELTLENCPATHGTVYDARNEQVYYVRKIGSLCWMESNLRYAGGGDNTYGDVKTLTKVSGSQASLVTVAQYADPGGSVSYADTTPAGGFYGYLYNWCAAMGGQAGNGACNNSAVQPYATITICPSGWRLPTGGASGEFVALNNITNGGASSTDSGLLNNFLATRPGYYYSGLSPQGGAGYMWSSTIGNQTAAYRFGFSTYISEPAGTADKEHAFSVRCVK